MVNGKELDAAIKAAIGWVARSFNQNYRYISLEADGVSVRVLGKVVWVMTRLDKS